MSVGSPSLVIVGFGGAGHACARTLRAEAPDAQITVIDAEPGGPINRMLVTKGILPGLLGATHAAQPPVDGVEVVHGEVTSLLRAASGPGRPDRVTGVRLADGRSVAADAVVVATGARPRAAALASLPSGASVHQVHTADDALRLRDALLGVPIARPERPVPKRTTVGEGSPDLEAELVVVGAGFVGTEVASFAAEAGIDTLVVGRSAAPLRSAVGAAVSAQLSALHSQHARGFFGRGLVSIEAESSAPGRRGGVILRMDDGTRIRAAHLVLATGVEPAGGAAGQAGGVFVDDRLRALGPEGPVAGLLAAGSVALLPGEGEPRSADHWESAQRQGAHVARTLLSDLGLGADPGSFRDDSGFTLAAYGSVISGWGYRVSGDVERDVETEAAGGVVTAFVAPSGEVTGAAGFNAVREVRALATQRIA